jgi:hypothetical protein
LATAPLSGRKYEFRVGKKVVGRIERNGDVWEARPNVVVIPGFPAIVAVELRDEESGERDIVPIECFDPQEPVSLFDLGSGRPVEAAPRLNPKGRYALVFGEDLTLSPEPDDWRTVNCGVMRLRLAALPGDAASTARLTLGGATVWEAKSSRIPSVPAWAWATLEVAGGAPGKSSIPMGHSYRIAIRHSSDVLITFVRLGMQPLEPKPEGRGLTLVGPITATTSAFALKSKWLIGLDRAGESARVSPEFEPTWHGGAILRGEVWEILDPANILDAGDARRSPVLIAPPRTWDDHEVSAGDWSLMEGEDWVSRPGHRPRPLTSLSGLGGRLAVRLGPFNAVPATPPEGGAKRLDALILADRVVDRGAVRSAYPSAANDDAHYWRIELANEIEIDEGYEVHWWDRSGALHHLRPCAWPLGEPARHDWWFVAAPYIATEPRALLVTYHEERLGTWWASNWAEKLTEVADRWEPEVIAELLCWFKLPALEKPSLPEIQRLAERWPTEVLRSWMSDKAPVGWRSVIRAAFRDWRPGTDQVETLVNALGAEGELPEGASALKLMEICPILMGRFLRARAVGSNPAETRMLIRWVRERIKDSLGSKVREWVGTGETHLDGASRITRLDGAFLKRLNASGVAATLDLPADDELDQRPNLDLAVTQYTVCRLLLSLDILQALEQLDFSSRKG